MEAYTFKPSEVLAAYGATRVFANGQKEAWASIICFLLKEKADKWEKFTFEELETAMKKCDIGMAVIFKHNPTMSDYLYELIRDGFLTYEEKEENFLLSVGDKLMKFYSGYHTK